MAQAYGLMTVEVAQKSRTGANRGMETLLLPS